MAIDIWFPLAIYYEDIKHAEDHKKTMLDKIYTFRDKTVTKRTNDTSSWTGDIHDIDQLHNDTAFSWLTTEVKKHTMEYLKTLGLDLSKIDVYAQRSWPIIAEKGQSVSRHTHPNANLSVVYYVSVGTGANPGATRFFNVSKHNELSGSLSSSMTEAYCDFNALNFEQVDYAPKEGRMVIFPSKQPHDVTANECDDPRVSISYDLVITAQKQADGGTPEFLMPSPSSWVKL
jgi:5-oxoprolinase (ATP-hydrolysing) subunit B